MGPLLEVFEVDRSGRERRCKEKGARVRVKKRSGRRGTAWGLSQDKSNSGGETSKCCGLCTVRQRRNEQIRGIRRARPRM